MSNDSSAEPRVLSTACAVTRADLPSTAERVEILPAGTVCSYDDDLGTLTDDGVEWVPVQRFDAADLWSAEEWSDWMAAVDVTERRISISEASS